MFNDVLWVHQGGGCLAHRHVCIHFVALHGEYAAVASWQSLQRAAEVCAVGRGSEIVDEISFGHYAEAVSVKV